MIYKDGSECEGLLISPFASLIIHCHLFMNPSLQSWENGKKVANGQEDCLTIEPTNPNTLFQKKNTINWEICVVAPSQLMDFYKTKNLLSSWQLDKPLTHATVCSYHMLRDGRSGLGRVWWCVGVCVCMW